MRFTKEDAEVWKKTVLFVPARYIRAFDVISNKLELSAFWGLSLRRSRLVFEKMEVFQAERLTNESQSFQVF